MLLAALLIAGTATAVSASRGRADLLLLEANPLADVANVRKVAGAVLRGRWMPAAEIAALHESIERAVARQGSPFEACIPPSSDRDTLWWGISPRLRSGDGALPAFSRTAKKTQVVAMADGKIKRLTDRGFGFIETTEGKDLFFHMSSCEGCRFDDLRDGQQVTFNVGQGDKGPRAENVKIA